MKRVAAFVFLLALTPALADPPALDLTVDGAVQTPLHLTEAALRALPATELTVQWPLGSHLPAGPYKGVSVMSLVAQAVTKDVPGKNSYIRHTVLVYGRDGYVAALAEGEFNPAYEGKLVTLAYEVDGKAFKDGLRLVVPGDKEGGRQVHDVVRIEVR
jgi:DMSO/TMAO reductase YedYZ molybdopterin-dependent catalytic subunit